jgi:hypothetical protein
MALHKQTKVTAWLALPSGWAKTHHHKSKTHIKKKKQKSKILHPTLTKQRKAYSPKSQSTASPTQRRSGTTSTMTQPLPLVTWHEVAAVFQCNLLGQRLIDLDLQHFGDKQKPKDPKHYRVEQHNINNLPENGNAFKSQTFVQRVAASDIDVTLIQEIGINWKKSKGRDKWHEWTGAACVHSNFAHSTRELADTDRLQPGGTAIVAAPSLQSRCHEKGQDPTGVGR